VLRWAVWVVLASLRLFVRYVLCNITCKSWCTLIHCCTVVLCIYCLYYASIVCTMYLLSVLCIYCLYYVSIVCTMYLLFVLCIYCLYWTPDHFLLRCRTAGYKSVTGRSCDRPSRHRFFFVFLGPRANSGIVPIFLFKVATTCFPCSPPHLNLE
jgi:hypothetical protein